MKHNTLVHHSESALVNLEPMSEVQTAQMFTSDCELTHSSAAREDPPAELNATSKYLQV